MLPWCKCYHKWVPPDIQLMGGLGLTCSLQVDKVLHGTYWTINSNTQMGLTWRLQVDGHVYILCGTEMHGQCIATNK